MVNELLLYLGTGRWRHDFLDPESDRKWPSRTSVQTAPNGNCAAHSRRPMSYDCCGKLSGLWRSPPERSWTTRCCLSRRRVGCQQLQPNRPVPRCGQALLRSSARDERTRSAASDITSRQRACATRAGRRCSLPASLVRCELPPACVLLVCQAMAEWSSVEQPTPFHAIAS